MNNLMCLDCVYKRARAAEIQDLASAILRHCDAKTLDRRRVRKAMAEVWRLAEEVRCTSE